MASDAVGGKRKKAGIAGSVPAETLEWLTGEDNPAVSVLTRRRLLGEDGNGLWSRRNEYEPVERILESMREDGSWIADDKDYAKYTGNLWQIVFLGEMWADADDERAQRAIEYTFSRQLPNGAWGSKPIPSAAGPCLTANVGRALARMGHERDGRVIRAMEYLVENYRELGVLGCKDIDIMTLNGYCHMLAPKILLFLAELPEDVWPDGAEELKDAAVGVLRDKRVMRYLPKQYREFTEAVWPVPKSDRAQARERFIEERGPIEHRDKPGWLRFGFPLSYNSDALEALAALAAIGEPMRGEFREAIDMVKAAADDQMRWPMKNSLNGKMIADVERKGEPSKWLTLRALEVLEHFGEGKNGPKGTGRRI